MKRPSRCPTAALRISEDSVVYLPTERATFRQLRALCPAAIDTFIFTPVDGVLEPALIFPFENLTVAAVQTRNDPLSDPIRVVAEDSLPDYWIVPTAPGVTFMGLPLQGLTYGRLRKALGPGGARLSMDGADAGFCYLPSVVFNLDLGDTAATAADDPDNWRPSDDLLVRGLHLGRALRDATKDFCP